MTKGKLYQSPLLGAVIFTGLMTGFFLVQGVPLFLNPPANDLNATEIRETGYAVVFLWAWGWLIATAAPVTWVRLSAAVWYARLLYTCGCLGCMFHVALAFHVAHEWSFEKAFEHTKQASGVGKGIYVNFVFALVWTLDVLWSWIAFEHYLNRPAWVRWLIQGFMGFIVFNAAVVFGTGMNRWFSLFWITFPIALLLAIRRWSRAAQTIANT